jgi:hypothetical protein
LEVNVLQSTAEMRRESMRQRPVSQMFTPKSLDQFFESEGEAGVASRDHESLSRRTNKERWSLRGRNPSVRNTVDLLRLQLPSDQGSPSGPEGGGGGEGATGRQRGHTVLVSPVTPPVGDDVKKRSNTFKLGKVLGDMGKGVSNAMAAIPLTPRTADRQRQERERILAEGARQAEQAAVSNAEDAAKWERKKKAVASKGKMNALLHSFGSSGDTLSRHIRKRSVSGKLEEKNGGENESENESDDAAKGGDPAKRKGSRIGERAKSFGDLHKVTKRSSASPIKKRGSTISGHDDQEESPKGNHIIRQEETAEDSGNESGTWTVFGGTLEDVMKFQKDLVELDIPIVLVALTSALIKTGTDQEGIFRVPGNKTRIDGLKARIAEGDYDFDDERANIHDLASLLKEWLQSLKDPVIPASLYEKCTESVSKPKECIAVVEELPQLNKSVLKYIISFLQTHVLRPEIQKITRMDIKSVATTFAPCLMRSPEVSDMQVMMANIQQEIKFVVNLLMLSNSSVVAGEAAQTAPP